MKLLAVTLDAFGHFTDARVDVAHDDSLTVLLGPNEAGKSTLLDAIAYALFGMPAARSKLPSRDFLHPGNTLLVSLDVQLDDGGLLSFARRRGTGLVKTVFERDPATGERGAQPSEEHRARVEQVTSGLTLERFQLHHGISLTQLREGAAELMSGDGELNAGVLLVASGLHGAGAVHKQLRDQLNRLIGSRQDAGSLNIAARELRTVRGELSQLEAQERAWDSWHTELAQTERELARLREQRRRDETSADVLERIVAAAHERAMYDDAAAAERAARAAFDAFDVTWTDAAQATLQRAAADMANARDAMASAAMRLASIDDEQRALSVDDNLANAASRIEQLVQQVGAYQTARVERPAAQLDVDAAAAELERAQADVGASSITVDVATRRRLRDASDAADAASEAAAQAERAVRADAERTAAAQARVDDLGDVDEVMLGNLGAAIDRARAFPLERMSSVAAECESRLEQLTYRSRALLGESATSADVEVLAMPNADDVARHESQLVEAQQAHDDAVRDRHHARQMLDELSRELSEHERERQVPDPDALRAARAQRDASWANLRAGAQAGEPRATDVLDSYEREVARADDCADALVAGGEHAGRSAALRRSVRAATDKVAALDQTIAERLASRAQVEAAWSAMWAPTGMTAGSVAAMRDVQREVASIMRECDERRALEVELAALRSTHDDIRSHLAALMNRDDSSGAQESLVALIDSAHAYRTTMLEQRDARRAAAGVLEDARGRERDARAAAAHARAAADTANAALATAADRVGIAADDAHPAAVRGWLDASQKRDERAEELRRATAHLERLDSLTASVERDVRDVVQLVDAGIDGERISNRADEHIATLSRAAQQANLARARWDVLAAERRTTQTAHDDASRRASDAESTLTQLANEHNCAVTQLTEIDRAWQLWTQAQQQRTAAASQLQERVQLTQTAIDAVRDGCDDPQLASRAASHRDAVERATTDIESLDQRRRELQTSIDSLERSERLNELRQTEASLVLSIARGVREYRHLHAQERRLTRAMHACTADSLQQLVTRTSHIMRELTRGRWDGVRVESDEQDVQRLVAVRADGITSVRLSGLSEGTRDQLYLALRLAALEHELVVGARERVPLIVDDVLMAFDDDRAAAALDVLARFAKLTQVIVLTHHEHIATLAESVGAAVRTLPQTGGRMIGEPSNVATSARS